LKRGFPDQEVWIGRFLRQVCIIATPILRRVSGRRTLVQRRRRARSSRLARPNWSIKPFITYLLGRNASNVMTHLLAK